MEYWKSDGGRGGELGILEMQKKIWLVFLRRKTAFFSLYAPFLLFFFPIFLVVCPSYFLRSFSERSLDRLTSLENFYLTV